MALLTILIMGLNSPDLIVMKDNFLYRHIMALEYRNPDYVPATLKTISQQESLKFKHLDRLGMKLKDKESILAKYRAMKKSIAKVQIIICTICNFLEKVKNLLIWKDHQRTAYFLILTFIIYVFVSRLPIRFFILLGGFLFVIVFLKELIF